MTDELKPTDLLASFLATVCALIGEGKMGNVSRAVVFIRSDEVGGGNPAVIVNFPVQTDAATIAEFEAALRWMKEGTPTPIIVTPSTIHPAPEMPQ
jgi:hypothetical protein